MDSHKLGRFVREFEPKIRATTTTWRKFKKQMSFFRELKRRSVFRVGFLYLASAWLLLQLTDVLSSLLTLPESVGPIAVLLLGLGFFPALFFAWAYEMTPEGLKRDAEVDRTKYSARGKRQKVELVFVVLLVLAIGGFVGNRLLSESSRGTDVAAVMSTDSSLTTSAPGLSDEPSVAVLPFVNLSGDPDQKYFAAGMTEDIITKLTHVRGMRVISSNSTMRYEGTDINPRQIGLELGVRHLLGGSVRKSGDRVRITAYLTDSTNLREVWREQWDRPVTDFFALQDEITANIINELEIKLVEGEQRRIAQQSTDNPDAYIALRRGIVAFETLPKTRNSIEKAREWFESATRLDPQYAAAFAWIALCHVEEVVQGVSADPDQSLAEAEIWTQHALNLDDSLSRVYDTLGSISFLRGELEQAYDYQRKALELVPGNADVSILIGDTLTALGRPEEALTHVRKGMDLNPYPPWWYWLGLGQVHMHLENYGEALEPTKKSLDMFPGFEHTRIFLVIQLMGLNREAEARVQAGELLRINPEYSVGSSPYLQQMKNHELKDRFFSFLRQAGLE